MDMVCQRWMIENQNQVEAPKMHGHCPENLNLDILVRVKRYRRLRRGEHVMALRQHSEMIVNVVRQLCRGASSKRPTTGRGDQSPGVRGGVNQSTALSAVNDILTARMPFDRLQASTVRTKMMQYMAFKPLLNVDGGDPDSPWPEMDPYIRYGADQGAHDAPYLWFEPLPPMLPNLEENPKLPPCSPDTYTLVLDLDETLVHYYELDGMGDYHIRPGMHEFLERMNQLGYELVIFTAATQDYADWVIDQIDPGRLIHYRLYRQHALPWGPIFVKDLSRLGRSLDRCLILDNVQENFMLQPHNGIFICTWYDDPHDTALFALTPLLDELLATRARVPEILDKYRDQIPTWAGFDQFSQMGEEYSELDVNGEEGFMQPDSLVGTPYAGGGPDQCSTPLAPPVLDHRQAHLLTPTNHMEARGPDDQYAQLGGYPAAKPGVGIGGRPAAQSAYAQPHAPGAVAKPEPAREVAKPQQQQPVQHQSQQQPQHQQRPMQQQAPPPQQHQQQHQQQHHQNQQQYQQQQQPLAQQHQQQSRPQTMPYQTQSMQPQSAPAVRPAAAPRPAFSASGVAGPYQAQASSQGAAQPRPAFSASGIAGPYQAQASQGSYPVVRR